MEGLSVREVRHAKMCRIREIGSDQLSILPNLLLWGSRVKLMGITWVFPQLVRFRIHRLPLLSQQKHGIMIVYSLYF